MAITNRPQPGIALNHEQETALREWFRQSTSPTEPGCRSKDYRLYEAIAPLMRGWWYEKYELMWRVNNGSTGEFMLIQPRLHGQNSDEALVRRFCDFLNDAEARK